MSSPPPRFGHRAVPIVLIALLVPKTLAMPQTRAAAPAEAAAEPSAPLPQTGE